MESRPWDCIPFTLEVLIENLVKLLHHLFGFEVLYLYLKQKISVLWWPIYGRSCDGYFRTNVVPIFYVKTVPNQGLAVSTLITATQQGRTILFCAVGFSFVGSDPTPPPAAPRATVLPDGGLPAAISACVVRPNCLHPLMCNIYAC